VRDKTAPGNNGDYKKIIRRFRCMCDGDCCGDNIEWTYKEDNLASSEIFMRLLIVVITEDECMQMRSSLRKIQ
jgi:hypothetical protein